VDLPFYSDSVLPDNPEQPKDKAKFTDLKNQIQSYAISQKAYKRKNKTDKS